MSTEFASPDTEVIVTGSAGITVPDTLLAFGNYLSNQQQTHGGSTINVNPVNTPVVSDVGGAGTGQVINAVDGDSGTQ